MPPVVGAAGVLPRAAAQTLASLCLYKAPPSSTKHSSFPSLALFAFWLRSSVVTVLFSLISRTPPRGHIQTKPIFGIRLEGRWAPLIFTGHSVARIALPRADANGLHLAHFAGIFVESLA
ncbi:hypothetical protein B0J12DRAFT_131223 [Macrophomina phaseolina]|uniref:Secreted protein n=1 Tax=Macrophomina phaseolina TaxID=35725 RepID=A0ABQ8G6N2_9PEZI|nr:hypothetical protein B0J12DRAFT_131223 [Macrophomina phaseolina]